MGVRIHPKRDDVVRHQRLGRLVVDATDLPGLTLILRSYLETRPMAFDGRLLLRRIQIDAYDAAENLFTPLKEQWNRLRLPLLLSKAEEALEKDPKEAVALAEDILSINPYDEQGNRILVRAAKQLGIPKLAVLALETVCRRQPDSTRLTLELADAYLVNRDYADARELFEEVLEREPGNAKARQGIERVQKFEATQETMPARSSSAAEGKGEAAASIDFEPRDICYAVSPLIDPLREDAEPVRCLCSILEPIEDQLAINPNMDDEWFQWIETELGPSRMELEASAADNPDDPDLALRLAYLRAAFLELPEARESFDVASRSEELEFAAYAGMTCCLMHEGILLRTSDPVIRAS